MWYSYGHMMGGWAAQGFGSGSEIIALIQLVVAVILGALIGLERSVAGKHVGMRTYALVALGACLFTVAGELLARQYAGVMALDPSRIAAGVVMGIGFIGTGLVVMRDTAHPLGLTTAAGVWVAAGVGVAIGFHLYILGIGATVLSLLIFRSFASLERNFEKKFGEGN